MAVHDVTLIPGDGIGPEVCAAARRVLDATGADLRWDVRDAESLEETVAAVRASGVALKGPVSTPTRGGGSVNIALRRALDLHTGIRPCRSLADGTLDVVVARMTGEDLYAGLDFVAGDPVAGAVRAALGDLAPPDDAGVTVKAISPGAVARVARRAGAWALEHGRARLTIVHKATVMRATDGVFLETAREVLGREFGGLEVDDVLVDTACARLVRTPGAYDVLLAPVQYGDILSDLCAGLAGGLGVAPGANVGDACAVFEAVHGTAPRHAGADRANPAALILSGAMLLRHLGEPDAARRVEAAVGAVVREGAAVTYDLRGADDARPPAGTAEMAAAVAAAL